MQWKVYIRGVDRVKGTKKGWWGTQWLTTVGSSHPSGQGELGSAEGVEEHQAQAGVTREHSYCWDNHVGKRKEFKEFAKVVQKENNKYLCK